MYKKLYRSRTNKMISGVCGGLENYLNLDVTVIRLIWVLIAIATVIFPTVVAYIIAALVIPEEPVGYENTNFNENVQYKVDNENEQNKQ